MSDKKIEVFKGDEDSIDGNLKDIIERLSSRLESVPDEFKDLVILDVEGLNNWGGLAVHIYYWRPKTLDEINQEQKDARKTQMDNVARAKQRYLELKEEFGEE